MMKGSKIVEELVLDWTIQVRFPPGITNRLFLMTKGVSVKSRHYSVSFFEKFILIKKPLKLNGIPVIFDSQIMFKIS